MNSDAKTESIAREIYSEIKERITRGNLQGRTRVTEQGLAREFGASRTPVREAMRLLVADGFLVFKPNSGSFVRSWTASEIAEVFDLRLVLESEVAARAAQHIRDVEVARLRKLQGELEANSRLLNERDFSTLSTLNREFHKTIAEASHNERLVQMLANTIEIPIVQSTYRRYTLEQLQRSHQHHRELCDALDARDADWARAVMHCHICSARRVMVSQRSEPQGDAAE